jgi:hypothetical protein
LLWHGHSKSDVGESSLIIICPRDMFASFPLGHILYWGNI